MVVYDAEIENLSNTLIIELTKAMALPQTVFSRRLVQWIFGRPARLFADLGVQLDRVVAKEGIAAGARWVLPRFVKSYGARGVENIPASGPLVIASNHPGSYDSLAISAHVRRPDYKIIVGDIPFFENLPHLSEHAIYAPGPQDTHGRMQVIRAAIRHLREGGSLLIFARGTIEPDPAFMAAPDAEFNLWSRSLQVFLERVPDTRVLVTIVSGVISQAAMRHPITRLRRLRPDRQRLAFLMQMAKQVLTGKEAFGLTPCVSFGDLIGIREAGSPEIALQQIIQSARALLHSHIQWQQ